MRKKEKDKRVMRRELRKDKLQQRAEEQKLPWEERKKRLQQRGEKERKQKNIKNGIGAIAIISFIIFIILVMQNIDIEDGRLKGGRPGGDYNPEDWESSGNVSMPEDDPDIKGMVDEKSGDYSFILFTRGGEEEYFIEFDENTNIFFMDMDTSTVSEASKEDIQEGARVSIWGEEQSQESWFATDIGIMRR